MIGNTQVGHNIGHLVEACIACQVGNMLAADTRLATDSAQNQVANMKKGSAKRKNVSLSTVGTILFSQNIDGSDRVIEQGMEPGWCTSNSKTYCSLLPNTGGPLYEELSGARCTSLSLPSATVQGQPTRVGRRSEGHGAL